MTRGAGFTLIEVLLSLTVIAVIVGVSAPIYQSFQNRNELDLATQSVVQSLRRAQILSQANDGDSTWGVYAESGSIVLFKGSSYAGRDSNYDELFDIPTNMGITGLTEIVFSKLTGYPNTTGTLAITSVNGESRNITINSRGGVGY